MGGINEKAAVKNKNKCTSYGCFTCSSGKLTSVTTIQAAEEISTTDNSFVSKGEPDAGKK